MEEPNSIMINSIQNILKKFSFQLKRYPDSDIRRRLQIIHNQKINCILDIGANTGQYGLYMRSYGYQGKILSFEPLKSAFNKLNTLSKKDDNWQVFDYGLGHKNTSSTINIANNSSSSSILDMLPRHLNSAPHSKYIDKETIIVKTLDSIYDDLGIINDKVMLKVDTQGYEKYVIDGAVKSIKNIDMIQLEMSIIPLYENEMLFREMLDYLEIQSFCLYSLENGFADPKTGRLLQVDGIFVKSSN